MGIVSRKRSQSSDFSYGDNESSFRYFSESALCGRCKAVHEKNMSDLVECHQCGVRIHLNCLQSAEPLPDRILPYQNNFNFCCRECSGTDKDLMEMQDMIWRDVIRICLLHLLQENEGQKTFNVSQDLLPTIELFIGSLRPNKTIKPSWREIVRVTLRKEKFQCFRGMDDQFYVQAAHPHSIVAELHGEMYPKKRMKCETDAKVSGESAAAKVAGETSMEGRIYSPRNEDLSVTKKVNDTKCDFSIKRSIRMDSDTTDNIWLPTLCADVPSPPSSDFESGAGHMVPDASPICIVKDGVEYSVGDCVFVKRTSPITPCIGRVVGFGKMSLLGDTPYPPQFEVEWFFRTQDTVLPTNTNKGQCSPKELFLGTDTEWFPTVFLNGKCKVEHINEITDWASLSTNNNHFFFRIHYSPNIGELIVRKGAGLYLVPASRNFRRCQAERLEVRVTLPSSPSQVVRNCRFYEDATVGGQVVKVADHVKVALDDDTNDSIGCISEISVGPGGVPVAKVRWYVDAYPRQQDNELCGTDRWHWIDLRCITCKVSVHQSADGVMHRSNGSTFFYRKWIDPCEGTSTSNLPVRWPEPSRVEEADAQPVSGSCLSTLSYTIGALNQGAAAVSVKLRNAHLCLDQMSDSLLTNSTILLGAMSALERCIYKGSGMASELVKVATNTRGGRACNGTTQGSDVPGASNATDAQSPADAPPPLFDEYGEYVEGEVPSSAGILRECPNSPMTTMTRWEPF